MESSFLQNCKLSFGTLNKFIPRRRKSIIAPMFKKGSSNDCTNHKNIIITSIVSKLLMSIIMLRLYKARNVQ